MVRNRNQPSKPPAQAPGAGTPPSGPTAPPEGTQTPGPSQESTNPPETTVPTSGKKLKLRVNWKFSGFLGKEYEAGDLVVCTKDEAAPYLGNVLSPEKDEA